MPATRTLTAHTTALVVTLGLALPLGACGEVTASDPAATELAKAICPKAWSCCKASQLTNNAQAGTDEASCEKLTDDALQKSVLSIKESQKKGRSTYDGAKVEACAAFIRGATCDELDVTPHVSGLPACGSFATPLVALDGACANDWECIGGFCDRTGLANGADGACHALRPVGQACTNGSACETALACDGTTMTCVQPPAPPSPPPAMCFYASGCSVSGGRGGGSLLALGLLAGAVKRRRRANDRGRRARA